MVSKIIVSAITIANSAFAAIDVGVTTRLNGEFVQQVGGEHVNVVVLDDSSSDAVASLDLVFRHGLGLDLWLDAVDTNTPTITLTDGLPIMKMGQPFHRELALPHTDITSLPACCQANARQDNQQWSQLMASIEPQTSSWPSYDGDAPQDPYVWLDPVHVMTITVTINEGLAEYDPAHAAYYDQQADRYISQLQILHEWIHDEIAAIPINHRMLLTAHDRFRYFAKRYGLVAPLHFPHALQSEAMLKEATMLAADLNINATFLDGEVHFEFRDFNQSLKLSQPVRLLITPDLQYSTYETMMRYNVESLVAAIE